MNASLQELGLVPFFSQQLSVDDHEHCHLARVISVQRSGVTVTDGIAEREIKLGGSWRDVSATDRPTVGDWVLLDEQQTRVERVLERKSVFRRVAAGAKVEVQLIAANVDTLFILTSCNEEFKESRLERYVALAVEAGVVPVVVLTKVDLVADPSPYVDRARAVQPGIPVEAINALDSETFGGVAAWISPGSTVALVGSSGVGKSTLANSLLGTQVAETSGIREDDSKGRHTTSFRAMHRLPDGGLLIDVPGMRELKVADLDSALSVVFEDIEAYARHCRFKDCRHESEPGCAVREAVDEGKIEPRRWQNYLKLLREDAYHTRTLSEQHMQNRKFGKVVKQMMALKRDLGLKK